MYIWLIIIEHLLHYNLFLLKPRSDLSFRTLLEGLKLNFRTNSFQDIPWKFLLTINLASSRLLTYKTITINIKIKLRLKSTYAFFEDRLISLRDSLNLFKCSPRSSIALRAIWTADVADFEALSVNDACEVWGLRVDWRDWVDVDADADANVRGSETLASDLTWWLFSIGSFGGGLVGPPTKNNKIIK